MASMSMVWSKESAEVPKSFLLDGGIKPKGIEHVQ